MKYSEKRAALSRLKMQEEDDKNRNPLVAFLEDTLLGCLFFLLFGWLFILLFSRK